MCACLGAKVDNSLLVDGLVTSACSLLINRTRFSLAVSLVTGTGFPIKFSQLAAYITNMRYDCPNQSVGSLFFSLSPFLSQHYVYLLQLSSAAEKWIRSGPCESTCVCD